MYTLNINNLTPQEFLTEYWQKKPLLIKGGFKDFKDPIAPDELAGLAAEEFIESRVVLNKEKWDVAHGPFEAYEQFGDTHWTLLVQAVDHWNDEAAKLLAPFRFIPNWRIDDLMVSFSMPKGGVGPHLDQYDVFIIQGEGKRHWKVGACQQSLGQFAAHKDLLQVDAFEPIIDTILEPGDILYIPPGAPHEGYAIIPSMNYSVGFRAPNQEDMLSSYVDYIIDKEAGLKRYSDPALQQVKSVGLIEDTVFEDMQKQMQDAFSDKAMFKKWFGSFITEPKYDFEMQRPEPAFSKDEVLGFINERLACVKRSGGIRCAYYLNENDINEEIVNLAVHSSVIECSTEQLDFIKLLTDEPSLTNDMLKSSTNCMENAHLLTTLINEGYWYFED